MTQKLCTYCNQTLPFEAFHKRRASADGLAYKCRACQKRYKEMKGAAHWKVLRRKSYERNREYENSKALDYYHNNRDAQNSRHKEYMRQTADQQKDYRYRRRAETRAYLAEKRAFLEQRTPKWLSDFDLKLIESVYAEAQFKSQVTGVQHHVDRISPLNGKLVSGLHVPNNLQVLTAAENLSKSNKYDPE